MSALKITNFRPHEKGSLKAFFSVTLPSGLVIHEVKLFEKESGNRWLGLPSRRFTGKDGTASYTPILEFRDRESCDAFRDAVLTALEAIQPARKPPQTAIPDDEIPF
jgi:DNA-binding cell septation regulator SpoVG